MTDEEIEAADASLGGDSVLPAFMGNFLTKVGGTLKSLWPF